MRLLRASLALGLLASTTLALSACNPEEECAYERPVARITKTEGELVVQKNIVLSGEEDSTISCDREHTFSWTFQAVPEGSAITDSIFQANNTPKAGVQTLQLDVPGTYVIRMFIFDGEKNSVEAIYVMEVGADNLAPEADAGPDQATTVGQLATFDGSDSYDPEGDLQVYRWLLEEAPPGSEQDSGNIFGADSDSAQFVPDVPGIYVFSLEVRDEFTWSNKDFVSLVVPTDNEAPIAEASDPDDPTVELTPCESQDPINLNGTRSYDPDGGTLTYEWSLQSAPDGSAASDDDFTDRSDPRPRFFADVPGDYVFELRVHDGELWSAWDTITVTLQDPELNTPPVADAGEDILIEAEAFCRETTSGYKCNPCPDVPFELDGSANSYDVDGDQLSYLWVQTGGPSLTMSYPTGPVNSAYPGAVPASLGDKVTLRYTLDMRVSDCGGESTDTITLTYTCLGSD